MVLIPEQLKDERFILVDSNKRPIEKAWTTDNNYTYDELTSKETKTYGVLTGHNGLLVLDCDDKGVQNTLMKYPELMDTFITQTAGKQLYHIYLRVENVPEQDIDVNGQPRGLTVDDKNGKRILDVQGSRRQVVGPGSTLPDGRQYKTVFARPIKTIDYKFLLSILNTLDERGKVIQNDVKKQVNQSIPDFDEVCAVIKQQIKPVDILVEHFGDDKYKFENPTKCPLGHGSEGGKSFHHTNDVWHCFHCNQSGNVIQLYQRLHAVEFNIAKRDLAKKIGLEDDIKKLFHKYYKQQDSRHLASELLAEQCIKIFHINTVRSDTKPEMWIYKNGIFIPDGKTYIEEFCQNIMGIKYNRLFVKNIIDKIMAQTYINAGNFFTNEDVNIVPVENGLLNLATKELVDFSPKYKFFNKLPVVYDPLAAPEKFLEFVNDILPVGDINSVQELFGYLLYRDYRFRKAFLFEGDGANGKSKLIEVMERFLGQANITSISLQELSTRPFAISGLLGKMANLVPDISSKELEDTSTFKAVTGHDRLTADRKFRSPIEFTNYAKMVFACNKIPEPKDDSDGYWERWAYINFPYTFIEKPNPDNPREKLRDINIIDDISSSGEMSGILNWALAGYDRLMKNGKFSISQSTADTKKRMMKKANPFAAFCFDEVIEDPTQDNYIKISNLSKAYQRYCILHKIKSRHVVNKYKNDKLNNAGGFKMVKKINGKAEWVWRGIKLKTPVEEDIEDPNEELMLV